MKILYSPCRVVTTCDNRFINHLGIPPPKNERGKSGECGRHGSQEKSNFASFAIIKIHSFIQFFTNHSIRARVNSLWLENGFSSPTWQSFKTKLFGTLSSSEFWHKILANASAGHLSGQLEGEEILINFEWWLACHRGNAGCPHRCGLE